MPPKKKKGGKKSGKKKNGQRSTANSASVKLNEVFNEVSKEFYVIQIRDLEQNIARYQEKCDKLELRNKELETGYEQQSSDKKEIVSFLKKQLEQRSDEIADLQEKFISLQQSKEREKDKYEVDLTTLRTEMQEVKDQLTSENMVLGGKLASLEEFRIQKEDLLNKFSVMEELLDSQEKNHKEQIYQLERKAVVDKDRLKKEMILRVNTVAAEFRKVSNKQMAETTKRTIRENVLISSQLSKMSEKTMELITENDDNRLKEKNLKQQIDILEDNEKELIKKNTLNQKVIRMLTEKARQQEKKLEEHEQKDINYKTLQIDLESLTNEVGELKSVQAKMEAEKCEKEENCSKHQLEIQQLQEDKTDLIGILSDATSVIKHALQQNNESDPSITEMKNTNLIYKVIEVLNLAVEMGIGIKPEEFALNRQTGKPRKNLINLCPTNKSDKSPRSSRASPTRPLAHYKLGDLGLIPSGRPAKSLRPLNLSPIRTKKGIKNQSLTTFYTDEQLAKGTPRQSTYELVNGLPKLPALSSIT